MKKLIFILLVLAASTLYAETVELSRIRPVKDNSMMEDIASQIKPISVGKLVLDEAYYRCENIITTIHESQHAVNSRIRMENMGKMGFYLGGGKAAVFKQPPVKLKEIAPLVEQKDRGLLYTTYVLADWDNASYLIDELNAYTVGARAAKQLNLVARQKDSAKSGLELLTFCKIVLKLSKDRGYEDQKDLEEFITSLEVDLIQLSND